MRVQFCGRELEVPSDERGYVDVTQLRRAVGVPDSRVLVRQDSSGSNHVVPARGAVRLGEYERFADEPISERG